MLTTTTFEFQQSERERAQKNTPTNKAKIVRKNAKIPIEYLKNNFAMRNAFFLFFLYSLNVFFCYFTFHSTRKILTLFAQKRKKKRSMRKRDDHK